MSPDIKKILKLRSGDPFIDLQPPEGVSCEIRKRLKDFEYGSRPGSTANIIWEDKIIVFEDGIGETGYQYLGEL